MIKSVLGLFLALSLISTVVMGETCDRAAITKLARMVRYIDQNHDSAITVAEGRQVFDMLRNALERLGGGNITGALAVPYDLNRDGAFNTMDILTVSDITYGYTAPCRPKDVRAFVALDLNQDGVISSVESAQVVSAITQSVGRTYSPLLDLNADGDISYNQRDMGDIGVIDRLFRLYN